ncbi:Tn3 family transposase [Dysgonomonas sp. HGC4]|uniref:Tn3 family transposase n=1 Tax=Dysgonomonas sp. HGC4 TaxID=1658009 RepID=UPI0012FCF1AB|nr:Tn3 family transposase [Dysgonomonas sp. HGC4]MBD8348364.1 Tn3 family transposase [Dysgonomonas sp. HGC4]
MELIKEILNRDNFNSSKKILDELENTGIKNLKDRLFYEELNKIYKRLANRVARILQILEFNHHSSNYEIYKAIRYYQQKARKVGEDMVSIGLINKDDGKYIYSEDGQFSLNLYKIFLFKAVFDGIKSGTLNLLFSERYKSVDDYMISLKYWTGNKVELLERYRLTVLNKNPPEILDDWKKLLDNHYKITNKNIPNNEHIKFNSNGTARVRTPKSSDSEEGSTAEFIGKDKLLPLSRILSDITYYVDYISSFSHYNRKNAKSTPSEKAIYAAIIALGCNIEIRKMGRISEGIEADILGHTVRWFFSKNNIDEANRKVIALINSILLSEIYLGNKDQVNTSSD